MHALHARLRASYLAAGSVVEIKRTSGPRPLCKSGTLSLIYHKRLMIDGMTTGRELKQSNLNIRLSYIVSGLRCRRSPEVQESFRSCSDLRSRGGHGDRALRFYTRSAVSHLS